MGEKKRRIAAGGARQGKGDLSMQAVELYGSGEPEAARALYRSALQTEDSNPEALHRLAYLALQFGDPALAVTLLDRAIARSAESPYLHNTRGIALRRLGRWNEAAASLQRAIGIAPRMAEAYNNLGNTWRDAGLLPEAFDAFRAALAIAPEDGLHWAGFGVTLGQLEIERPFEPEFRTLLAQALARPEIAPGDIKRTAMAALRDSDDFAALLGNAGGANRDREFDERLAKPASVALLRDPLLLRLLETLIVPDRDIELILTAARRLALAQACGDAPDGSFALDTLCAIARQCFLTEYAYIETSKDALLAQQLGSVIESRGESAAPWRQAVYATFRPLGSLKNAERLAAAAMGALGEVFRQQVVEPREEQRLRPQIARLSSAASAVSVVVQAQYEANPYPPWTRYVNYDGARPLLQTAQSAFPQFDFSTAAAGAERPTRILVAGCGTGSHPIQTALRFANAQIVAIDLSLASLAYALRKTRELGVGNIEYCQADILSLPESLGPFELIESVGVLHHLLDPLEGWRKLLAVLAPGGLMRIGLYSEAGRRFLARGKALAAASETTDAETLRSLRAQILADQHDQDLAQIRAAPDFYSLSGCRDLLAHVQEHQFTLPQLASMIEELELEFLGFELPGRAIAREFRNKFADARMNDLSAWHQFETAHPMVFVDMYRFWARRRYTRRNTP
jgi:SAM-dependent methyltransferase/Tfp pilus assembly protein PilF